MDRKTFLETLNKRNVPKSDWQFAMDSYRNSVGNFDDDRENLVKKAPVAFKPNAILNYDPRKELGKEELETYNKFTTEEDEYKFISHQFLSEKYNKDTTGYIADALIRKEMNLKEDEPINYGAFVTKAKFSYPPESDEWMVDPEERFIMRNPDQEPVLRAAKPLTLDQKEKRFFKRQFQKRFDSANSFLADIFNLSPVKNLLGIEQFKQDVLNDNIGRRKLNGQLVTGSGSLMSAVQNAYYGINFNQQYNALTNAKRYEEADKLKAEYDNITAKTGSAFDYREKNWLQRAVFEGLPMATPMAENLFVGIVTRDRKKLARVINLGYWANQGAGQVKSDVIGDRKLTEMNPNEINEINTISNVLSLPYAATEFMFAALPTASALGSTVVRRKLADATVKVFKEYGKTGMATKIAGTTVLTYFGERLEEGIQETILTLGKELAEESDPEKEAVVDALKDFSKLDFKEAFAKGKEAFDESKYAVLFMSGTGVLTDIVQSNREYQSIQREREYLTQKRNMSDDEALRLAIEKHGILGKDKQKTAMVQIKSQQLIDKGVEEAEAKKISEALVNARTKKETKEALFNFNKVILTSYAKQIRNQINSDLSDDLLLDFDVEGIARMLSESELETDSVKLAEELEKEAQDLIDKGAKNLKIKLVTETLAQVMDRSQAREYAIQLEELDGEANEQLRRKISMEIADIAADFQVPNMPYSKLGFLTEDDFTQLKENYTEEELEELFFGDLPLYQFPQQTEKAFELFKRGIEGDKEAQAEYNQSMQDARDLDYDKFLKAFNLLDARFQPSEFVNEQSELDSQPFRLSDDLRDGILAGNFAQKEVEEIANTRGISIEEARILVVDLIEQYGVDIDLSTETETEEEKSFRIQGIQNISINVTKALSQIAPDVKIITHDTSEEFTKATGQTGADGLFIGDVDGSRIIHIDNTIARPETVAHEAFHALVNSLDISNIDTRLFEIAERVKPYLEKSALEELDLHLNNYKNVEYKGEESLAKMVEILSRNYQALPQPEKNIIVKFIESIIDMLGLSDYADAIFNIGFKTRKGIPKRDKQVINFLNTLSVSLSEGITIQQESLDVLRPDIETLNKKDLVARAKELGVPSYGTKAQILERVRGKFGKRELRASYTLSDKIADQNPIAIYEDLENLSYTELQQLGRALKEYDRQREEYHKETYFKNRPEYDELYPDPVAPTSLNLAKEDLFESIELAFRQLRDEEIPNYFQTDSFYEDIKGFFPPSRYDTESQAVPETLYQQTEFIDDISKALTVRKSIFDKEKHGSRIGANPNVKISFQDPSVIQGKTVSVTMADRMLGGKMGNNIFLGGILYPELTGRIWASDRKAGITKLINQAELADDGYYYLAPVIMADEAQLSNRSIMRAFFFHFQNAINNNEINLQGLKDELERVFTTAPFEKEKYVTEDNGFIKQAKTMEELFSELETFAKKLVFQKRRKFIETLIGRGKKAKWASVGNLEYFTSLYTDPKLNNVENYEIVNVIRFKGNLTNRETSEFDQNHHDAYEHVLETDGEVEVIYFTRPINATKAIRNFKTSKGVEKNSAKELQRMKDEFNQSDKQAMVSVVQKTMVTSSFAAPFDATEARDVGENYSIRLSKIQNQDVGKEKQQTDLENEGKAITVVKGKQPKKTVKAYKLFRLGEDGKLYPLFVRANEAIPEGEWVDAKMGTMTKEGRIKAERGLKTVAARGGFHAGDYISATHIGGKAIIGSKKTNNKVNYRKPDHVWAEVEFADDKNWQSIANERAEKNKDGSIKVRTAHITDQVPDGGYYRYKTNPNMQGNWLIGGNMKVVKRLSLEERKAIMEETNIFDLPDLDELVQEANLQLEDLSEVAKKELQKFYPDLYSELSSPTTRASKKREPIPEDVADIIKGLVTQIKEQPLIDEQALNERTSQSSLTREDINKTREAYFIEGEAQDEVQHFESVLQRVQKSYTTDGADQLVKSNLARLKTDKTVFLEPSHVFTLALRKDQLEREIQEISRQVEEAQNNGDVYIETTLLDKLNVKIAFLEDLLTVSQSMSSQFARGLRFVQLSQTKLNLYSLPRIIETARKQKGEALTKEERKEFSDLAKKISDLDDLINKANEELTKSQEEDLRKSSEEFISTTNKKYINKVKRQKVKIIKDRNEILKRIREMGFVVKEEDTTIRFSKVDQLEYTPELRKEVANLARTFIEEGVTDLDTLISNIRTHLPEKSEYDIMNILSNRIPAKRKQVDTANKNLLIELKKQARLRAEIQDLLEGVIKEKKLIKPDSAEVKKLKAQLKQLRQQILNSDDVKADAIYDRIRRIEEGIEEAVSPRSNKKEESARLQQAKQDLREIQRISKIDEQIKQLQAELKLSPKELLEKETPKKQSKPIRNKELENKIKERAALQAELRDKIYNMQQKGFGYWYREIAGVPRALLATADMSYLLRQGLIVSAGHPILAAKSFGKAFQAFFSKGNARLFDENLRNMDLHPTRLYYGLELSTMEGALTEREESFATTLLQKIIGIREIVGASERHMVTGLNHLRTGLFDDFISKHPEASEEAKFAYARYVNVATGRGELGQFNGAATALSQAFFSPRFAVSRIQAPAYAISNMVKQPELRGEMARQWLALAGTATAVLALASANGADVGDDPEDTDFGKFVIGNRRYDIFGGMVQPIRLLMLMIKKNDSEYFQLIYDEKVKKDVRNEMFKFVEYKFNPILSLSHKLLFKEDPFTHQDINWSEDWKEQAWSFAPIVAQSLKDAYDQEYNAMETASVFIPEFLGVGVGVYEKRNRTKKKASTPKYY
jgi:hypothetical protein